MGSLNFWTRATETAQTLITFSKTLLRVGFFQYAAWVDSSKLPKTISFVTPLNPFPQPATWLVQRAASDSGSGSSDSGDNIHDKQM